MRSPLEQFIVSEVLHLSVSNYTVYVIIYYFIVLIYSRLLALNSFRFLNYFVHSVQNLSTTLYKYSKTLSDGVNLVCLFWLWFFSISVFLACSNLFGLLPFSFTLTAQIILPLTMSCVFFIWINFVYWLQDPYNYFSLFLPAGTPTWLLVLIIPIEILSYVSRMLSLSIRLFANMMSGHTLLKILSLFIFLSIDLYLSLIIPFPFFIFQVIVLLEFGVAFLQIYVFLTLSVLYLKDIQ